MKLIGMSDITTSLSSSSLIAYVINTDSSFSVGLAASYFLVNLFFLCPFASFLPLIVTYNFSFNNMIDSKRSLLFCGEKSFGDYC